MLKEIMDNLIRERKNKHPEDDYGIYECWDKMTEILSQDIDETIQYLENCLEEDIYFISEIFEDISEKVKSEKYIICLRKLDKKFPNLNMTRDIDIAEGCF